MAKPTPFLVVSTRKASALTCPPPPPHSQLSSSPFKSTSTTHKIGEIHSNQGSLPQPINTAYLSLFPLILFVTTLGRVDTEIATPPLLKKGDDEMRHESSRRIIQDLALQACM